MILLVDDKPENLFSLSSVLSQHGFSSDTAQSGEEALKKLLRHDYALVILDVQMPVMDGITATRLLRARPETARVPIIALTAYSRDADWQTRALEAGCIDCLSKPLEWARFEDVLRKIKKPGP